MSTGPVRRPMGRTPVQSASKAVAQSSGFRGAEGRRKMAEEEQASAARREAAQTMSNMPFRFYCKVGESKEFIIVDSEPDFFRYEHTMMNKRSKRWDIHVACINEHANCPVCKHEDRPAYFAMYLTIIDLTPYTAKDGTEVEWSKKLLVVKSAQQKKFTRWFEKHGSLRGMVIRTTRDGDKDSSIGNDLEFDGEVLSEDDLLTYVTEYETKDGNGKMKSKEILGYEPYDYDELFPLPTERQLSALVQGKAEPGSRDYEEQELRGGRKAADDWEEGKTARAPIRRAARAAEPDADTEEEMEEEEAAPPPRRGARTAAAPEAPARRTAPVRRAAAPEEEDEEPPQRAGRLARPATREPVDDVPSRAVSSLAEKRRALRR